MQALNTSLDDLNEVYLKNIKNYINIRNFDLNDKPIATLLSYYKNILSTKNDNPDLRLKLIYKSIKTYLLDEENILGSFINEFEVIDESNFEKIINRLVKCFVSLYDDVKYKSLCISKFLIKLFEQHSDLPKEESKINVKPFLNLKDIYLDTYYFDDENRDYLKSCITEYCKIKFAAKTINKHMAKILNNRKSSQIGSKKLMDYCVFKAATGKMVLIELLGKIDSVMYELKNELE